MGSGGLRKEYSNEAEERRKETVAPLKYKCLKWHLVVFLVNFSSFTHRPSSPAVLSGVNNCLHLVELPDKELTDRKKKQHQ